MQAKYAIYLTIQFIACKVLNYINGLKKYKFIDNIKLILSKIKYLKEDNKCIQNLKKISEFDRGIIHQLLVDGYSFDNRWKKHFESSWIEFDNFFFDNLEIADKNGFITTLDGEPIGHISWDPRYMPEYIRIGHNCISTRYKGNGYGKMQLQEAISRISEYNGVKKIVVSTNSKLTSAQYNYESVGFKLIQRRENKGYIDFLGENIDYEIIL